MFAKQFIIKIGLAILTATPFIAQSQVRYYDPSFAVGVKYNIEYGKSYGLIKKSAPLLMDVYQPLNDSISNKPIIIFAHGGGYIIGNKNNYPLETICSRLAQMGYVCASINYSLGYNKDQDADMQAQKTVLMAMQDMKAAVRFFKASAKNGNPYGIDANEVWVGGSSSGAITALHTAFFDSSDAKKFDWKLSDYGGLHGLGGNNQESNTVKGVINLSGAIGDTNYMQENIPVLSIHGAQDPIVPFKANNVVFDFPGIGKVPKTKVMGSYLVHKHLTQIGVKSKLLVFENKGHCPYDKVLERKQYTLYTDETINMIRSFLFEQIQKHAAPIRPHQAHCSEIKIEKTENGYRFYLVDKSIKKVKLFLFDKNGERIKKTSVKKKLKSFYWNPKKLPDSFELRAVYNSYRTNWLIEGGKISNIE